MTALRDAIRDRFGVAPTVYRAGRYGLGPDSASMLAELGFRCDTSVRSGFDYRAGPGQIGRASGRGRECKYVSITVVAGSFKKKTQINEDAMRQTSYRTIQL